MINVINIVKFYKNINIQPSVFVAYLYTKKKDILTQSPFNYLFTIVATVVIGSLLGITGDISFFRSILFLIIFTFLTFVILDEPILYSFLYSLLYALLSSFSDMLSFVMLTKFTKITISSLNDSFFNNTIYNLLSLIFLGIIIYSLNICVKRNVINIENIKDNKFIYVFFIFVFLLSLADYYVFMYFPYLKSGAIRIINIIFTVVYLLFIIAIVFIYSILRRKNKENEQLKLYINTITNLTQELRRFKHDYLNILHSISGYIENKEWDALDIYFKDLMQESKIINNSNILSLNKINEPALLGLLSAKINYAERLNVFIDLYADENLSKVKNIKLHHLCEILGIYVDNAVEAATLSENKIVNIKIVEDEKYISIVVENSYKYKPEIQNLFKKGYSTKGYGRGNGLWSVKMILSKYKYVVYNTIVDDKLIKQELFIPKVL